jgi:ActR/RegA family two-component response regulator
MASYDLVTKREKQSALLLDDDNDGVFVPNLKSDINDRSSRVSVGDTNMKGVNPPRSGHSRLGLPDIGII